MKTEFVMEGTTILLKIYGETNVDRAVLQAFAEDLVKNKKVIVFAGSMSTASNEPPGLQHVVLSVEKRRTP